MLMKFYRITTCDHIHDLSGEGAYLHGGRWNSKGTHILYTAESMALSMMEALAHITMVNQKRAYCRVVLDMDFDMVRETGTTGMETWFKEVFEKDRSAHWHLPVQRRCLDEPGIVRNGCPGRSAT